MIECAEVKKALKRVLIVVVVMLVVIAALLPAVVPPVVERLVTQKLAAFGLPSYVRMHLGFLLAERPRTRWRIRSHSPTRRGVSVRTSPVLLRMDRPSRIRNEFNESIVAELLKRYPITG